LRGLKIEVPHKDIGHENVSSSLTQKHLRQTASEPNQKVPERSAAGRPRMRKAPAKTPQVYHWLARKCLRREGLCLTARSVRVLRGFSTFYRCSLRFGGLQPLSTQAGFEMPAAAASSSCYERHGVARGTLPCFVAGTDEETDSYGFMIRARARGDMGAKLKVIEKKANRVLLFYDL
jgi:hypothetical protein